MFKDEIHTQELITQNAYSLSERLWDVLADRPSPAKTSMLAAIYMCKEIGISPLECIEIFSQVIKTLAHVPAEFEQN